MGLAIPLSDDLRARLGKPTRIRRLASSPRSRVWRAELGGTAAIVKQVAGGADADARYHREVAALRLAARARPLLAPAILGTDPGARVLVLEFVADRGPAPGWVVEYAATLARLHAVTGPADAGVVPPWSGPTAADADAFLALAGVLGVPVPPQVPGELGALLGRLDPAGHYALLHGDPCPGNDLYADDGVCFVDFEQASLGNGLTELAYLRIGFPTCWCSTAVPPPLRAEAEAAYREAWRSAAGTDIHGGLADACAGWLIRGDALVERAYRGTADHLAQVTGEDWRWGTGTARERLAHRLAVVAAMTTGSDQLSGLGQVSSGMRDRMLTRWPSLAPLPAERP
jgi:tRNA A-37 threonylcarbamoyl transferase component Bud32